MKGKNIQDKREKEKAVVGDMIALYCRNNHGTNKKYGLCTECQQLLDYARSRSDHCPFMETKTFCVNCRVHCYKPEMREKIRQVMRYAGPRMIFYHPATAISHMFSVMNEKRKLKKEGKQKIK